MLPQNRQMSKKYYLSALLILLLLSISFTASAQSNHLETSSTIAPLDDFQLVAEDQGWVLIANQVFWTSDNGASWDQITPDLVNTIRDIHFIDTNTGFLVSQQLTHTQEIEYSLLATHDQGKTWSQSTIVSYPIRDPRAITQSVSAFFLNDQLGWLVFRQGSSANFNIGQILYTEDGGQSWQSLPAPLGEPVQFLTSQTGYIAGGLAAADLYHTDDHGESWEKMRLTDQQLVSVGQPNSLTPLTFFVPAIQSSETGSILHIFASQDAGTTWEITHSSQIASQPDLPAQFLNLPGEIKILAGTKLLTYYLTTNQLTELEPDALSNLTRIDFVSDQSGWASINSTDCEDPTLSCESVSRLTSTTNSGLSWQLISTPSIFVSQPALAPSDIVALDEVELLSRTSFLQGQGYDQCEISSLSNLQAWKNNSPLAGVNLYIGGNARACANTRLSQNFVEALSIQGWKFIPTWVGPQAACTNFSVTMSPNPSTAEQQGRDQASDSLVHLYALGLSEEDYSGSVVYYDLEAFDVNNTPCLNAAKAFINGWVELLHEAGVTAGVYGSVCASGLDEFYALENPPDVIWPALWTQNTYHSAITSNSLPCISDSQWGDHQRILQYTGTHPETWGNVTMSVDLDVIDGIVADISRQVGVPASTLQNPSFETGALPDWEIQNRPSDCNWQVIQSTERAHSGDYYLSINRGPADTNCSGISQAVTHTPIFGDRYRFAIWAKSSSPTQPRALTLKITGDGVSPSAATQYFSDIPDQWVCLETNYDVSSSDLTAIISEIEIEGSDGIDLFLDNAHLSVNTGSLCPTIPSPTNLIASSGADQSDLVITWDSVPNATYYEVYRSIAPDTTKIFLTQTTNNYFADSGVTYWDVYNYWVRACTAGQCSAYSQIATGNIGSPHWDFFDGFETGDTSKWVSVTQPDLVSACSQGSLKGLFGLCLDTDTTTAGGVLTYDFSIPTREAEVGFIIDPNNFESGGEFFTIIKLMNTGNGLEVVRVILKQENGQYKITASGIENTGVYKTNGWFNIPDSPTKISLAWYATLGQARSSTPILSGFTLWIDGNQAGSTILIDNLGMQVDRLVLGAISNSNSDQSSGIVYIDDFYYQAPLYYRQ